MCTSWGSIHAGSSSWLAISHLLGADHHDIDQYCFFVMRADNQGEGGILALMTLTGARWASRVGGSFSWGCLVQPCLWRWNYYAGHLGLSAGRGLNVATSIFRPYTMPMALVILVGLFAIQHRGTGVVGRAFGPVIWYGLRQSGSLALSNRASSCCPGCDKSYPRC